MDDGYIDTNAHLRARVSDLECELAEQCRLLGMGSEREARLMALLAESQAREAKLRKACEKSANWLSPNYVGSDEARQLCYAAIALPSDDTALREMIAAEREACAKVCQAYGADMRALYKGRPPYKGDEEGRASPYIDGQSDAAYSLMEAIRARS